MDQQLPEDGNVPTVGHLKSGLVNFILPCSVAIWSASGTASSQRDRTHSLSHLQWTANQLAAGGGACSRGRGLQQLTHLQRISALRQALRSYTSCIFITWVRGRGSWRTGSSGDLLKTWTLGRSYLLQEQRQELHQLVRGQRLHVGLREGAQIRLLRLTEGWRTLVQL